MSALGAETLSSFLPVVEADLGDVGKLAVEVVIVQAVTNNEMVVDREAGMIGLKLDRAVRLLVEQHAGSDGVCAAFKHELFSEGQCAAGVENVVDEQYVSSGDIFTNVVDNLDRP